VFVTGDRGSIDEPAAWRTTDGGQTWAPVLLGASETDIPDAIFVASSGKATYAVKGTELYERSGTARWTQLGTIHDPLLPLDRVSLMSFRDTPHVLLAGLGNQFAKQSGALLWSADGGRTWSHYPALAGLAVYDILVLDDAGTVVLVATHAGVFRTRDAGASWVALGPEGIEARIRDLARDARSGAIFAATSGRGIWKSMDEGSSWVPFSNGLQSPTTYAVETDPLQAGVVWAGLSGGGLYRSTDGGKSWKKCMDGLDARTSSAWRIVFPKSRPDRAMIATNTGLYCWKE
jgi:photosystem II stability/assembly factor-like uncharacterized protein